MVPQLTRKVNMNGNDTTQTGAATVAHLLAHNWSLLALRGLAAVIFGVLAFLWPRVTLFVLVWLFGAFALVNGVLSLVLASKAPKGYPRLGSLILSGILGVVAGVITFFWPAITAIGLLILIAWWAIVTGILEIFAAIKLRKTMTGEWLLVFAGIASVAFGVILLIQPSAGALVLIWWIGAYAIVFGILLIALAFRMRSLGKGNSVPATMGA
jgi:uncharacterized membrane protein HdeD (DUF308 family)